RVLVNYLVSCIRCENRGPKGTAFRVEPALTANAGSSLDAGSSLEPPFAAEPAELEGYDSNLRSCSADWSIGRFKVEMTEPWVASSQTGVSCWGGSAA
ncbi:MAG: hypothetical protein P1U77_17995, partial [Rubripirellula sp.]|nr:hypothetical protein [Rubripirellula sp.]